MTLPVNMSTGDEAKTLAMLVYVMLYMDNPGIFAGKS